MSPLVRIQNTEHLTAMIKAIVPRSFEKTFGGLSTAEIVAGFSFCTQGLSQTELNTGLAKISEMGFCPDPALFAKWCRGVQGFNNTDSIATSYIGKHGALNAIIKWQANPKTPITVAMKQAYDETNNNEATFKQLVLGETSEDMYLRPLNPNWHEQKMVPKSEWELVGKVVGKWVKY